jgi:hypothetical protein
VLTENYDKLLSEAMHAADASSRSSSPSPSKRAKRAEEPGITTELEENLRDAFVLACRSDLSVMSEWYMQSDSKTAKRTAKLDLVVFTKKEPFMEPNTRRLYDAYAYMEFGVCEKEDNESLVSVWSEKMDQLLSYLNATSVEKYRGAARAKGQFRDMPGVPYPKDPVILSVLVWSKSRNNSAIGTFVLEWCSTSKKFRMALLSAKLCCGMEATSAAFGKVVSLIQELTALPEENQLAKDAWTYLGPDCARVGEKVS